VQRNEVVVIGAGLAGLRAAAVLAEAGRDVLVLEAQEGVGGRERTDEVDGFLLDRGFHVINPAYPALRRAADLDALRLHPFPVGVDVHRGRTLATLAHPLRHPALVPAMVRGGLVRPGELAAVARWALPAIVSPRTVIAGPDRALREGWNRAAVHGVLRAEVLEPFLAGVLADADGTTSDAFARLLVRMFALGRPGLPARGVRALPEHLADRARRRGARIRTGARVITLAASGRLPRVDLEGGRSIAADAVVIAVDAQAAAELQGTRRPLLRGLQTWWFAPEEAPSTSALLRVDGTRSGPVVNSAIISHPVPSYAPSGRHLLQASCVLPASGAAPSEAEVRGQLSRMWRVDATRWPLLRRDDIPGALPALPPPLRTARATRVGEGVFVCGDHQETPSIQGALVSGERAAAAVLRAARSR
jgi:phytoene dehydrogenase-like protein